MHRNAIVSLDLLLVVYITSFVVVVVVFSDVFVHRARRVCLRDEGEIDDACIRLFIWALHT